MKTSQTKTKEEMTGDQPPKPVAPPREPLNQMHDGTAMNHYYFRDKKVTVEDVSAPGFFNFMRDNFRSGSRMGVVHMVTCHLGEAAEGLTEVDLHLVDAPSHYSGPVIMAAAPIKRYKPGDKT